MKKLLLLFVGVMTTMVMTGCSTFFNARNTGAMAGVAVYTGYNEVAKGEIIGDDLQTRIAKLWEEVNKLEKIEDVKATADKLSAAFDEVIASKKLTEAQKANLLALKNMVMDKVNSIIDDKLTPNSQAVDFLLGFREGVNACIDANKDVNGKKVTAKEAATAIGKKVAVSAAKGVASKALDSMFSSKTETKAAETKAATEVKTETKEVKAEEKAAVDVKSQAAATGDTAKAAK